MDGKEWTVLSASSPWKPSWVHISYEDKNHQGHSLPPLSLVLPYPCITSSPSESDSEHEREQTLRSFPKHHILVAGVSPPRRHKKQRFETPTRLQVTIASEWSSQLRWAHISEGSLRASLSLHTHTHTHSHAVGPLFSHRAWLAQVRYCTTRNMTTQVSSIPPIMKYLSWKARFSMSRITVLDKPSILAMSRSFFWVPWDRQEEEETKINSFYQGWVNVIMRWGFTNRQSLGHA